MAVGLQIWDSQGRTLLDASSRAGRVAGIARIDARGTSGARWQAGDSGAVAADLSAGSPFWAFYPDWLYQHVSQNAPVPIVDIDSTGIRWRYSYHDGNFYTPMPGMLVYGVY